MSKTRQQQVAASPALTRRQLTFGLGSGGLLLAFGPLLPKASAASSSRRVIEIFLRGGWDSALATDPPIGDKVQSGAYEAQYQSLGSQAVGGKGNLVVGAGLIPAIPAFQALPTAFVNGIHMEVTAHFFAESYMYSGKATSSATRVAPALTALLGNAAGGFPAHLVLGTTIPLGDTSYTAPPLQASSPRGLADSLAPPGKSSGFKPDSLNAVNDLIKGLDQQRAGKLSRSANDSLASWSSASNALAPIFAVDYGKSLTLTSDIKSRYGAKSDADPAAHLAAAFLALSSGLTPFVAVNFAGFDTHSNHVARHLPVMKSFAGALAALAKDLTQTPDPQNPKLSLADTTTIVITSEFTRTPKFNGAGGTDHWPSASMIFLGKGISDNTVVGATDANAQPLGWQDGPVPRTTATALLPDHVIGGLLDSLGSGDLAKSMSDRRISGPFST